jgi:hypothetical protein
MYQTKIDFILHIHRSEVYHERIIKEKVIVVFDLDLFVGNQYNFCRSYGFTIFFFCSTLSEFENFLLCERILINVTTCQNETSS